MTTVFGKGRSGSSDLRACGHGYESKRDATAFLEELFRADLLEEKRKAER
jgi:hypothetical protein